MRLTWQNIFILSCAAVQMSVVKEIVFPQLQYLDLPLQHRGGEGMKNDQETEVLPSMQNSGVFYIPKAHRHDSITDILPEKAVGNSRTRIDQ